MVSAAELFEKLKKERKEYLSANNKVRRYRSSCVWHAVLLPLLKLLRVMERQNIHVVGDKHTNARGPVLYACTHIGFYDIMILFEVIKKPCWLFWGNPGEDLTTIFGWMARKNGAILIDSYDKEDRKMAVQEAEILLRQGGSLMIFPEGAWNISENELVMKLFKGTVSMAKRTGAEIIPIAIEQYGKSFYVNIGQNIKSYELAEDVESANNKLRNVLATLKWEIIENQPMLARKDIPCNMKELFVEKILADAEGKYTVQMIEAEKYHDKTVISREEVFSFIKILESRNEFMFLFDRPLGL